MTHNRAMVTQQQLAEMLSTVNVEDVARVAKVSTKTVYRLRHQLHSPNLVTVERLLAAIEQVNRAKARREPAKAD